MPQNRPRRRERRWRRRKTEENKKEKEEEENVDSEQMLNHHVSIGHKHQFKVAMRSHAFFMRPCVAAVPWEPHAPNTSVLRPLCPFLIA